METQNAKRDSEPIAGRSKNKGRHLSEPEGLRKKNRVLNVVNHFASALIQCASVDDIAWYVAQNIVTRMGFVDCVLYLLDSSGEYFVQRAASGTKNPCEMDIRNPIRIKMGEGIVGTVGMTGNAEIVHDTSKDARYILDDERRLSKITVPILCDAKNVIGVIDSEHPQAHFFTQTDLEILSTIASIVATKLQQVAHQEQLQRTNESLRQFVYAASHDLKEPLRMIAGFSKLLEKNYASSLDEKGLEYLHFLMEGSDNMGLLVDDLLSYIHLSKEQPRKQVDCNEVMRKLSLSIHVAVQENQASIRYGELPFVWGHFSQMLQLFQNLVSNGIKYRSAEPPSSALRPRANTVSSFLASRTMVSGLHGRTMTASSTYYASSTPERSMGAPGLGWQSAKKSSRTSGGAYGWNQCRAREAPSSLPYPTEPSFGDNAKRLFRHRQPLIGMREGDWSGQFSAPPLPFAPFLQGFAPLQNLGHRVRLEVVFFRQL